MRPLRTDDLRRDWSVSRSGAALWAVCASDLSPLLGCWCAVLVCVVVMTTGKQENNTGSRNIHPPIVVQDRQRKGKDRKVIPTTTTTTPPTTDDALTVLIAPIWIRTTPTTTTRKRTRQVVPCLLQYDQSYEVLTRIAQIFVLCFGLNGGLRCRSRRRRCCCRCQRAASPFWPLPLSPSCTDSQARLPNTNRKPIAERRQPYVDWEPSKVMNEKYRQSNK